MLTPVDGWTPAHGLVGFFLGRIQFKRWQFYPIPIGWEIYQLFFHYQPQGHYLGYVWLNSLSDILACSICYEIALRHSFGYEQRSLWRRLSNNAKAVAAYFLIAFGIIWAFWDDIFRLGMSAQLPAAELPLVIGAFSPAIASFITLKWIKREAFNIPAHMSYYLYAGFLPSLVILLIIMSIRGFYL